MMTLILMTFVFSSASFADSTPVTPVRNANVRVNPLGIAFGVVNATLDLGAGDNFTVGPSAAFMTRSANGITATGFGIGIGSNIFLGHPRFTDSWILAPEVGYAYASGGGNSASGTELGLSIDYGWFWSSGFNLALGAGIEYVSLDYSQLGLGSVSGLLPSLTLTIGYAF
jgi:hypothetical protein